VSIFSEVIDEVILYSRFGIKFSFMNLCLQLLLQHRKVRQGRVVAQVEILKQQLLNKFITENSHSAAFVQFYM